MTHNGRCTMSVNAARTAAFALAAAMSAAGLRAGETYWLDTSVSYNSKPAYPNPLTNAWNWIALDGETRAGAAGASIPSDGIFYLRGNAKLGNEGKVRLQTTGPSSYTFGELHIGELSTSRSAHLIDYCKLEIVFNGIMYFEKGLFSCNQGTGGTYTVNGDIYVKSPDSDPFQMAVGYTGSALLLKGTLSSDVGCTLKLGGDNGYSHADPANATYRLNSDLSGYYGTLWLHNDDTTVRVDRNAPHRFRFDRSMTIPGTVMVDHDSLVTLPATSTAVEVGTLSLGANVMLRFAANDTDASCLTVANEFSHNGAVAVELAVTHVWSYDTVSHTMLTVPVANAFCMDDFECTTTVSADDLVPFTEGFSVVTNDVAGTCSLVYTYGFIPEGVIHLNPGDSGAKDNNQEAHYSSSLTNAAHWSDGHVPEAGKDYWISSIGGNARALRSLQRSWTDEEGHTARDYTFPGDSLSIARGGMLVLCADKMRFNKLRLYDGAIVRCANVSPPATKYLSGDIEFVSGTVYLRDYVNHTLKLEGTVSGSGEICLEGDNPTGSPKGNYNFADADMSAFKGRIRVSNHHSNKDPDFDTTNQFLHVTAAAQLGGRLDAFDPAALTLERHGTLWAEDTFDITADNNRGITVSGAGRIKVKSAQTLGICTPLSVTGILRKDEAGTLRLASALTAGEEEGVENVLELVDGTLRLAHAEAVDGMTLAVSNGTSIVVEMDPGDPARAAQGIRMEKSATPFVLADGLETLPLTLEAAGEVPAGTTAFTLGIFTVTNDAAVVETVRSILPAATGRLFQGFSQEPAETEDAQAGTHTFALSFKKRGFVFSLR